MNKQVADITEEVRQENRRQMRREIVAVFVVAAVMLMVNFVVQSRTVHDFWAGLWYSPSEQMATLATELELTSTGERILKATQPVLEARESFNEHCDSHKTELSLLGCYTEGKIYVYEITEERLSASNKVTLAHELLHAAWERMGSSEREEIREMLAQVRSENEEWFATELEAYSENEQTEEVWTRAGTKLRELPEELEAKYAKYFRNRLKIVEFYDTYQAPFRELQARNEELRKLIFATKDAIERERDEYLKAVEALDAEVAEFNECAEAAGCFETDEEFETRRTELTEAREKLLEEREKLNAKIDENNARVEEYQANQMMLGELTDAMNSNVDRL